MIDEASQLAHLLWGVATLAYHPGRRRLGLLEARARAFIEADRADTKTLNLLAWGLTVLDEDDTPFFGAHLQYAIECTIHRVAGCPGFPRAER